MRASNGEVGESMTFGTFKRETGEKPVLPLQR
jgi:hypothetical protein